MQSILRLLYFLECLGSLFCHFSASFISVRLLLFSHESEPCSWGSHDCCWKLDSVINITDDTARVPHQLISLKLLVSHEDRAPSWSLPLLGSTSQWCAHLSQSLVLSDLSFCDFSHFSFFISRDQPLWGIQHNPEKAQSWAWTGLLATAVSVMLATVGGKHRTKITLDYACQTKYILDITGPLTSSMNMELAFTESKLHLYYSACNLGKPLIFVSKWLVGL